MGARSSVVATCLCHPGRNSTGAMALVPFDICREVTRGIEVHPACLLISCDALRQLQRPL